MIAGIICADCKVATPRTSTGRQIYCPPCSENRDRARKNRWAKANPAAPEKQRRYKANTKSRMTLAGEAISVQSASPISDVMRPVELLWLRRIAIPFDYAVSKNHIYSMRSRGHVFLRKEGMAYREMIGTRIKLALDGQRVARNKVWLDFLVQKSNHKGDAVNVVDTICDAIKGVIDLDDRWFAIRRLDWEIVKFEPKIYLGIGQESAVDVQACSSCGRLLEYENFSKHKSNLHGISRNCRECVKVRAMIKGCQVTIFAVEKVAA